MSARTVDWTAPDSPPGGAAKGEGLRERKKRRTRQQLTDVATELFLERGFDAVRVAEIAEACGVSEKTVFNYFPTKESLVLDHPEAAMAAVRSGFADPAVTPTEAALRILATELDGMTSWLADQQDPVAAGEKIRRFDELVQGTPSLRAHQRDMTDRIVVVAATVLAGRAGMAADAPEPQIAATALLGLWKVQFGGLRKYLDGTRTPEEVRRAVTADVRAAARLVDGGLAGFGV
ncbi:TetR family transcriptional regulator [Umezawaea tangerina]|uniref:TetR family transcriptional regulator n=1 Tax=Umezawaea tangerina TaxID=84725 RepID=A0A2T0SZ41_9PSEU|nr:TetR family transcriptional regulator [Umezawaea tangerina]PRY38669.1 TetR family transcriptional regulator [Umezawaea tangerina]